MSTTAPMQALEQARVGLLYDLSAIDALMVRVKGYTAHIEKLEAALGNVEVTATVTAVEKLTGKSLKTAMKTMNGEPAMKK